MSRLGMALLVLLAFAAPAYADDGWRSGFAEMVFTSEGSAGIRAVVLETGGERVALVAVADLFAPSAQEDFRRAVLAHLPAELGIDDGNLLLATVPRGHLGEFPLSGFVRPRERNPGRAARLTAQIIRAAAEQLAPARLRFARVPLRGLVDNPADPSGPLAESAALILIQDLRGTTRHLLVFGGIATAGGRIGVKTPTLVLGSPPRGQTYAALFRRAALPRLDSALNEAEPIRAELSVLTNRVALPPSLLDGLIPRTALLMRVRLGDVTIAAVPGEMTAALRSGTRGLIEADTGGPAIVVSRANGHLGTFATRREWFAGRTLSLHGPSAGDVVRDAVCAAGSDGTAPVPPGAEASTDRAAERVVRAALAARLRRLHRFLPEDRIANLEAAARRARVPYDAVFLRYALAGFPGVRLPGDGKLLAPSGPRSTFRVERHMVTSTAPSGVPENDVFPVEHYVPDGPARGAVIVLPIWRGGVLLAERIVAAHLAQRGYRAAIMPLPYQFQRSPRGVPSGRLTVSSDLDRTRASLVQAGADVRRLTSLLRARADVKEGRVGVVGISLGAFVAAVAYQNDPGLRAGVFVMAGGDPATLVWNASRETRRMKAELVEKGVSLDRLRSYFEPLDPARDQGPGLPPRPRGILMVNAKRDSVVPRENALLLHRALEEPKILWFDETHYSMATRIGEILERVDEHLDPLFPVE